VTFGTKSAATIFFFGLYVIITITACALIVCVSMLISDTPDEYLIPVIFLSSLLLFEFILMIIVKKIVEVIEKE